MTGLRLPPEAEPGTPGSEGSIGEAGASRDGRPEAGHEGGRGGGRGRAGRSGGVGSPRQAQAWLRWGWRQLTSMRTALILLFLLAVGSVPGSLLPQDGTNPAAVSQYYAAHPSLAPILARLSLFNVFGAPWFAAIYLLLFLSLVGCVLPRTLRLAGSARQPPPRAPRHVDRLPMSVSYRTALAPEAALESAAAVLSGRRFRMRAGEGWVAAEKGYLREAGNLLFHIALLGVLVSIGLGGLYGYKADRLLVEGTSFSNTVTALDEFHPGRLVSPGDLQPFTLTLDRFSAAYVMSGAEFGQPASFNAAISYSAAPGGPARPDTLSVNHPLNVDGVRVFLIGHGYAPEFRVTDGTGHVVFEGAVPFIPVETSGLTSEGAVKVPDAEPQQLGFVGVFLPTTVDVGGRLESEFPAPLKPAGEPGLVRGEPRHERGSAAVGVLAGHRGTAPAGDRAAAAGRRPVDEASRWPGDAHLPGYRQWISLAITYDPGQLPALVSGIAVLAGLLLSFMIRRRRVFVRARPVMRARPSSISAGSARSDAAGGFEDEFSGLAAEIEGRLGCAAATGPTPTRPRGSEAPVPVNTGLGRLQQRPAADHGRRLRARHAGLRLRLRVREEAGAGRGQRPGARAGQRPGGRRGRRRRCR